ncbi:MAG: pantoate--beta-alanine ligase [Flavobacteriaceae bacterium]|nr:pantoate--beta-alanine ligase [Flavobacteriaceae bacterium]
MNIFNQHSILNDFIDQNQTVGLVPTMGALHKGHMSLIERALNENDQVIVTVFVNPTQFEDLNDLKKYPKNLYDDVKMIEKVSPKIIIYAPESNDLYESSIISSSYEFGDIENIMEGNIRVGHFQGVATIVEKLLTLLLPTNAYFGEKDFQQLLIIKSLVVQKKISTAIIGCPIYRDNNGLALSSRNSFLSESEKNKAPFIFEQLKIARSLWGIESAKTIIKRIKNSFLSNHNFKLDYFEIRFENNLLNAEKKSEKKVRAFIAAKLGKIRLIDNLALDEF